MVPDVRRQGRGELRAVLCEVERRMGCLRAARPRLQSTSSAQTPARERAATSQRRTSSAPTRNEQVAVFHSNRIEPIEFGFELFLAAKFYNYALVAPEVNFDGSALLHGLKQNGYGNIYRRQSFGGRIDQTMNSLGWFTDKRSKYPALEELRVALARSVDRRPGGIIVHCAKTLKELDNYGHLKEHRQGSYGFGALDGHDDLAMALAITIQALHQSRSPTRTTCRKGCDVRKRGLFDDAMEHARNMRDRKEAFEELGSGSDAYFQDRF